MQKKSVEKKNFQRMCVVCRNRFDKNSLTRFAVRDGKVVVDKTGNAEGRGAYVCDNPDCMLNLVRKKNIVTRVQTRRIATGIRVYYGAVECNKTIN